MPAKKAVKKTVGKKPKMQYSSPRELTGKLWKMSTEMDECKADRKALTKRVADLEKERERLLKQIGPQA